MKIKLLLFYSSAFFSIPFLADSKSGSAPNIVLIMADDMGYETLSSNGSESCKSPNLDRLAAEGIRFINCFSNPICTPSRVKIMTGQYNVRNYVKFGTLDREQTTFAHQLKSIGYKTCIAGKWQLGNQFDSPQHFGFQDSCLWQHTRSGRSSESGKRVDRRFVNPILEINGQEKDFTNGEYGPQVCTDFICNFIEKNKDKPFLVYYPMILTHCPFDPTPDSSDWDPKRLGSTSYKGDQNDPQRHFMDMVAFADKMVGQIVSQLENSGIRKNTLLLFTGDNGTDSPIITHWKGIEIRGGKGQMTDEGIRVPLFANWPDGISEPGRVVKDLVEFCDFMPSLCEVSGADLPIGYPGDGTSILPVLRNDTKARKKDWIYVWYRDKVMVRNEKFSLLADHDGANPSFTRYAGPFDDKQLRHGELKKKERKLINQYESIILSMAETRLSTVSEQGRIEGLRNKTNR